MQVVHGVAKASAFCQRSASPSMNEEYGGRNTYGPGQLIPLFRRQSLTTSNEVNEEKHEFTVIDGGSGAKCTATMTPLIRVPETACICLSRFHSAPKRTGSTSIVQHGSDITDQRLSFSLQLVVQGLVAHKQLSRPLGSDRASGHPHTPEPLYCSAASLTRGPLRQHHPNEAILPCSRGQPPV